MYTYHTLILFIDLSLRAFFCSFMKIKINKTLISLTQSTSHSLYSLSLNVISLFYSHYTVVAPGTIHTNGKYNVAVALHQASEPATVRISLLGPQYNDSKTIELQPYEVKNISFTVPILRDGNYNITAEGLSGLIFKNSTKLNHNVFQTHVKIQTDKGKYKPGDAVNFRVLFMDENLKPSGPSASSVIWFEASIIK